MRRGALLAALCVLTACSGPSPTGAPPGEDKQLDEAAASLDANSSDTNAAIIVDEGEGSNESQPK